MLSGLLGSPNASWLCSEERGQRPHLHDNGHTEAGANSQDTACEMTALAFSSRMATGGFDVLKCRQMGGVVGVVGAQQLCLNHEATFPRVAVASGEASADRAAR